MLKYYNEIRSDSVVYSIDMLVLKGSYHPTVLDFTPFENDSVSVPFLLEFKRRVFSGSDFWIDQHYENFNFLTYRDMWVLKLPNNGVVRFLFGFQGYKGAELSKWRIEFNPNKCLPCQPLMDLIRFVWFNSSFPYISSFDLACDFPCKRSECFLVKDKRKYMLIQNSAEDKTEYLGSRHSMGFTKLYNKRIESHLDYDLTRFEVACVLNDESNLFSISEFLGHIPRVFFVSSQQMDFDDYKITGTDLLLLNHCIDSPSDLSLLERKKREKVKTLMSDKVKEFTISEVIILKLFQGLRGLIYEVKG